MRRLGLWLIVLGALPWLIGPGALYLAGALGCLGDAQGHDCRLGGLDMSRPLAAALGALSYLVPGALAALAGLALMLISLIRRRS